MALPGMSCIAGWRLVKRPAAAAGAEQEQLCWAVASIQPPLVLGWLGR